MYLFFGFLYRNIIKKILFLFPADIVHEWFLSVGFWLGKSKFFRKIIKWMWRYEDPILEQNICGLDFKNPIGLSAGFDYNADLVNILPSVGFGFNTVGTLTNESYAGNPKPMLARLPKSKSLLVNKGFKNKGIDYVLPKLELAQKASVVGVSIGATNKTYETFEDMIQDMVYVFQKAERFKNFDFYELNISCPNLLNLQNLKEQIGSPSGFEKALVSISALNIKKPIFVKMPLERSEDEIKGLIEVAYPFTFIRGLIFSNLAKDRTNKVFDKEEIKNAGKGNFSGKPVEEKSNQILNFAYKNYHERFILIGVGGVFTAEDAYKKIKLGASLAQMITGMVFMGPQQIGQINKDLAKLLKADGYRNISEAIGSAF